MSGRILIIEDEPESAATLAYHLAREANRVRTVADSAEAFRALEVELPERIVLAWRLRERSGQETLRELRERPERQEIPDRAEAEARLTPLRDRFEARQPALDEWLEATAHETLGCYARKDLSHRRRPRTMNGIEYDHAEMRRGTRVVRIFPNEASRLRLSSALAAEWNEQWMERRYVRMDLEQEEQLVFRARAFTPEEKLHPILHLTRA